MGDLHHINAFIYTMLTLTVCMCVIACICVHLGHVYQQYQWNREDERCDVHDSAAYLAAQYRSAPYIPTLKDLSNKFDLSDIHNITPHTTDYIPWTTTYKHVLHECTSYST